MADSSLHDARITGIEHKDNRKELVLNATLPSNEKCRIVFQDIHWWELCSFGIDNVLVSIDSYNAHSLTDVLITDQDIPDQYVTVIGEGHYALFVIKAAVGLAGWIIATKMTIDVLLEK